MLSADELFKGRHFDREVIVLCVRWYLRFKLSFRDLVEMMAERGISLAHTTIIRWVQRYVPEFARHWSRFARPVGRSWRSHKGINNSAENSHVPIRKWERVMQGIRSWSGLQRFVPIFSAVRNLFVSSCAQRSTFAVRLHRLAAMAE